MAEPVRCAWVPAGDALYAHYHDTEWGVPNADRRFLFEHLVLEAAQAGLSWRTILGRRQGYHAAFAGFDPAAIAVYGPADVDRLLQDTGIIRNRRKIEATIKNARAMLELESAEGDFGRFIWSFVDGRPVQNRYKRLQDVPAQTELSARLGKELKRRGFSFVGPTSCYAFMQAVGMVNDHPTDCWRHEPVAELGKTFEA